MKNERILYSARGHFFNYFGGVVAIIIGLLLTGLVDPRVPEKLKDNETVKEMQQNIDKKKYTIKKSISDVFGILKNIFPKEFINLFYQVRGLWFGIVFLFLGFVRCIMVYIKRQTNEYCVTSKRIIFKFGFLTTDTNEINLDRIEGVKVQQTVTDKIVGRGDVLINGVGSEFVEMKKISDPTSLRKAILEAVNRYASGSSK
ncbi:MAG: PH domain-containing protein [Rickettsiales bacterium]|nr:PH domain-containing protein [Pseudomonadota bacterium]MDG4543436.1 PH domain-containing protein [Rickettsiales bacterium]MDG4546170.1 PH domain-containing protein [Rickettsiales bacterium]